MSELASGPVLLPGSARPPTPTDLDVVDLVLRWFRALDRHDDVDEVVAYLADEGFELRLAHTDGDDDVRLGHDGFRGWYDDVTRRFFDEEHVVRSVEIDRDGPALTVRVLVNWQTRVWDPPAAHSTWLGFDAAQTWRLVVDPTGQVRVQTYVVHSLTPMPGSSGLRGEEGATDG